MNDNERNDLQVIIDAAIEEMAREGGEPFDPSTINLAEFCRLTNLSRGKARTIKKNSFKAMPHGRCGLKAKTTVLTGYAGVLDDLLRKGVTNSEVCFERIAEQGYEGSLTSVKVYLHDHTDLVPAKRKKVEPQKSRGQRFTTSPGEAFQMDWGFLIAKDSVGIECKIACFAMVCRHCGSFYVEFFPNARQENLFIGMIHAFMAMGVPEYVLTDNMKSVILHRDAEGHPVWHPDYGAFMGCIGFKTKLCKPRHPYTKGKVERLVSFVKHNFAVGRTFVDITQLNAEALAWCDRQGSRYRRALDCIPAEKHADECLPAETKLDIGNDVAFYLCPSRKISFDGFVSFEGRRFGVPYWYEGKTCRVNREGSVLHIYSEDMVQEIAAHVVSWTRRDSFCADQYAGLEPVEQPTAPVTTVVEQLTPTKVDPAFAKFDFEGMLR